MSTEIGQEEYETHIVPLAAENWETEHSQSPYTSAATYADMLTWAEILRNSYATGELEITWR